MEMLLNSTCFGAPPTWTVQLSDLQTKTVSYLQELTS
jgi:hypothetical protein